MTQSQIIAKDCTEKRDIMYLKLSENIINLRRKKGITQDELATFLGVTKASVSKWETKQSYPDILLLPQIASYFNVSIDELLGYEPQLSEEQIKKCYQDLATDFAKLPFDEVIAHSRELIKKYYSCYPLLMQIVILWVNHYMLTKDQEKQVTLLNDTINLCDHVLEGSSDMKLCSEASIMKSIVNLTLGNAKEVIEELQPLIDLKHYINQSDILLIQAYQMIGDIAKADFHSQITVYTHLLSLVDDSIGMLYFRIQDYDFCNTTIQRIEQIIHTYEIENLHPNTTLKFHYQVAVFCCTYNQIEKALQELSLFVHGTLKFIDHGIELHGDHYFTRIEEWFEEFALKKNAPRNDLVVLESIIPAIENTALSVLFDTEEYQNLKKKVERKIIERKGNGREV